jgi:CBS domain-containing protein
MAKKVRELMTESPTALDAAASVAQAARQMREMQVGDVLVTKENELCGIVTDRDIVLRCIALDRDPAMTPLETICSRQPTTLSPDDDTDRAMELMRDHAIRRLPVVAGRRLVGIVSLGDLAIDRDRESVLGEISAAPATS